MKTVDEITKKVSRASAVLGVPVEVDAILAGAPRGNRNAAKDHQRKDHIVKMPVEATIYKRDPSSKFRIWNPETREDEPVSRHEVTIHNVPHEAQSADYGQGREVGSLRHPHLDSMLPLAQQQHGSDVIGVGSAKWNSIEQANEHLGFKSGVSSSEADRLSGEAHSASAKAQLAEHHKAAAEAHDTAGQAHDDIDNGDKAQEHYDKADWHRAQIKASSLPAADLTIAQLVAFNGALQIAHWEADTKSNEHKALGELYDAMVGLTDKFAEAFMGKNGVIKCPERVALVELTNPTAQGLEIVEGLKGEVEGDDLLNILADMEGALNKAAYLLKAKEAGGSDNIITAKAGNDVVHCRATSSVVTNEADPTPWKQGQETSFMYMPAGKHTICAGFRGKSILLTVDVNPERDAQTVQASFVKLCSSAPKQKPFGCIEHEEKDASVWAKGFTPKADGIYLTAEPSALGETHVNGRIHRSWSPSFLTDADYSKAKLNGGVYQFPDGVKGSESNPANITGVAFCVGTLTNNPAFRDMNPVRAKEMANEMNREETITATWTNAAREASAMARSNKAAGFHGKEAEAFGPSHISQLAHQASARAYRTGDKRDHADAQRLHEHAKDTAEKLAATGLAQQHEEHIITHRGHAGGSLGGAVKATWSPQAREAALAARSSAPRTVETILARTGRQVAQQPAKTN